jgi:hypothetical protein
MHEYGILIGQIDIDSILLSDKTPNAVPRICKFDFAQILFPGNNIKDYGPDQQLGPVLYWAPEVCLEQPYD